ncbi:MAG: SDR family NAD(P)-dependent oxidoreductase [Halieaceae bacterium]|jgi:NAD(P)-dependent dehydrogenase (short-subunit alcohol dehydrogenase family)|nr:SDR family NAD(P)-dependent oxidoreductase [Halieaceae bacterium]
MKDFSGKLAVVTGGGTGMGRELVRQLVASGCNVAFCDVLENNMAETKAICDSEAPPGVTVTTHVCDVSDEAAVNAFRDSVVAEHATDHVNLLFNNAGVGGGGSFINDPREQWERTFNICWGGVYLCSRAFVPLLINASEAHLINTSSVNGFWASIGPQAPHTAYSSAKFAVKGFSEALLNDFRNHAPHVKVSVVMPGHIGTPLLANSGKIVSGFDPENLTDEDLQLFSVLLGKEDQGKEMGVDEIKAMLENMMSAFAEGAPTSASEAVAIILDGVREERWRILVGDDAKIIDQSVRSDPEQAYEQSFMDTLRAATDWKIDKVMQ